MRASSQLWAPETESMLEAWSQWKALYGFQALIVGTLLYAGLLGIPFFPAFEVGLCLMSLFGSEGITLVYLATVGGLCGSYWVGSTALGRAIADRNPEINLDPGRGVIESCSWLRRIGNALSTRVMRSPAMTLAALLNMPFNSVLGGGGGIALAYGASGKLSIGRFAAVVAAAALPLPALMYFGVVRIESYIGG